MGKHAAKLPPAPNYMAPPAYSQPAPYQAPAPYSAPSYMAPTNPSKIVPYADNYQQTLNQAASIENQLPAWMNLLWSGNPLDPAGRQQYEDNFYQTNINPLVQQATADAASSGQIYGSFAGGQIGGLQASGKLAAYQAGLNYAQQYFNNKLAGRKAFYDGPVALSQYSNQAAINRGLKVAELQSQNVNNQNNFNLNNAQNSANYSLQNSANLNDYNTNVASGLNKYNLGANEIANNFNLGRYGGQLQGAQIQNQANQNNALLTAAAAAGSRYGIK